MRISEWSSDVCSSDLVILIRDGRATDITRTYPPVPAFAAAGAPDCDGEELGALDTLGLSVTAIPRLLSPIDLQCVKASGVTFAVSAIERVIEERARGDAGKAAEGRGRLEERIGGRSEERRVGKACVSTGRSGWSRSQ